MSHKTNSLGSDGPVLTDSKGSQSSILGAFQRFQPSHRQAWFESQPEETVDYQYQPTQLENEVPEGVPQQRLTSNFAYCSNSYQLPDQMNDSSQATIQQHQQQQQQQKEGFFPFDYTSNEAILEFEPEATSKLDPSYRSGPSFKPDPAYKLEPSYQRDQQLNRVQTEPDYSIASPYEKQTPPVSQRKDIGAASFPNQTVLEPPSKWEEFKTPNVSAAQRNEGIFVKSIKFSASSEKAPTGKGSAQGKGLLEPSHGNPQKQVVGAQQNSGRQISNFDHEFPPLDCTFQGSQQQNSQSQKSQRTANPVEQQRGQKYIILETNVQAKRREYVCQAPAPSYIILDFSNQKKPQKSIQVQLSLKDLLY